MDRDLHGHRCIVAALVSAKDKLAPMRIDIVEKRLAYLGAQVVGRLIQRRGVSRGGVRRMEAPVSAATHIGSGKARELASLVSQHDADTVVFLNSLTTTQISRLEKLTACKVRVFP
jgi:hypothetical protein